MASSEATAMLETLAEFVERDRSDDMIDSTAVPGLGSLTTKHPTPPRLLYFRDLGDIPPPAALEHSFAEPIVSI